MQRDARVARLRISPGQVDIACGSSVVFTSVAEDSAGMPVAGVTLQVERQHVESG